MGLLTRSGALVLVAIAGCYAPEVRDCTVKCETATDCAADQLCSAGYCVGSSDVACATNSATTDAGTSTGGGGGGGGPGQDASVVVLSDAAIDTPPPDAATHGILTVRLEGKGSVLVQGIALCSWSQEPCAFVVPLATTLTAYAVGVDDFELDRWTTTSVCPDVNNSTCTFTPQLAIEIGAKFRKDN